MKFYIYKITFESGRTYIGQHTQRKQNDKYITSSVYYKRHRLKQTQLDVNGLRTE